MNPNHQYPPLFGESLGRPTNLQSASASFRPKIDRSTNLGLAVVVLVSAWALEPAASAQEPSANALPVEVTTVRIEPSSKSVAWYAGTVRSGRASRLGFERGGLVQAVLVEEGDRLSASQPIARLDVKKLRVARRRLQAALARARAQRGLSRLTAERLGGLAEASFMSEQKADEARFGRDAADATVDELEASLAQIDTDLGKSVLRAPFAGVVIHRLVDEGSVVGAGTPVVEVQASEAKEAFVGVPVSALPVLKSAKEHQVRIGSTTVTGRVLGLVDDVDPRTRTVGVVIGLPEAIDPPEGQVARLGLEKTVAGRGAWLPLTALTGGLRGLWTVYAVREAEGGYVVQREAVEVLNLDANRAFVTGTLEDGDRVLASGLHRVVPGQIVRLAARGQ